MDIEERKQFIKEYCKRHFDQGPEWVELMEELISSMEQDEVDKFYQYVLDDMAERGCI